MSHAGPPPLPDDDCPNPQQLRSGPDRCSIDTTRPLTGQGEALDPLAESIRAARHDARVARDCLPFVVHSGRVLYMVAEEDSSWIVAELVFDAMTCTFSETRRITYQWPREALGRLMSRSLAGNDMDGEAMENMAEAFTRWLAAQFVA